MNKLKKDYQLLFRNVPTVVVVAFCIAVTFMNLMANKIIFQPNDYVSADAGFLLSWIPFLCMDITTKRFGAKASIMLNTFAVVVNVICVLLAGFIAWLPSGNGEDFSAFNTVFGSCWFIVIASITAMLLSGVANSLLNSFIGSKMKEDTAKSYYIRTWLSTFFGQWLDNFVFAGIAFGIFAPIFWGWGYSLTLCVGAGVLGALLELFCEMVFSPLGYKICRKWERDNVGAEWLELMS